MLHNNRMLPALLLAIFLLTGCKEPVGLPSNDVHTATTHITYCTVADILEPTGRLERWEDTPEHFDWYSGTITVGYDDGGTPGDDRPRDNGVCVFEIPPFDCSDAVPVCTLFYYQGSHTQAGEGESVLVNWWYADVRWPLVDGADRAVVWWAIWNSTDTLTTDVIHANNGWYKVALDSFANAVIGDSGAWYYENKPNNSALFHTGWVYHGSVDDAFTYIAGAGGNEPYIKVVYEDYP